MADRRDAVGRLGDSARVLPRVASLGERRGDSVRERSVPDAREIVGLAVERRLAEVRQELLQMPESPPGRDATLQAGRERCREPPVVRLEGRLASQAHLPQELLRASHLPEQLEG
jgi:hypothetical protein